MSAALAGSAVLHLQSPLSRTRESAVQQKSVMGAAELESPKRSEREERRMRFHRPDALSRVWFWAVAVCSPSWLCDRFCWLLYIDSSELKIQSPNNLGDLSLHLTLIKNLQMASRFGPDSPIFVLAN